MSCRTQPSFAPPACHPAASRSPRLRRTIALRCGLLVLAALLSGACGQKGPLYLPQPSEQPQPAAPSDPDE